ncbi:endonuclease III [Candidatus Woesearchaeota archaeon]|nr:endonuclease III [Candidatus Woesearchaeota archaeon]
MGNNQRALKILVILKKEYKIEKPFLNFETDFQLLTAVILSAQCTDERVNMVTKELFKKVKFPKDLIKISQNDLEKYIFSTGFYRNKAKHLKETAELLEKNFKGKVPNSMEQLLTLKGVHRKTANVILGYLYNKKDAFPVDTHILRVTNRLKLTQNKNPTKVEQDIVKITPSNDLFNFSTLLIMHGRKICKAKNPTCSFCKINKLCPSAFKFKKDL